MFFFSLKVTFPPLVSTYILRHKQYFNEFILSVAFETKSIHTFQMKNYFNSQDDKNNFVNSVNHCITVV